MVPLQRTIVCRAEIKFSRYDDMLRVYLGREYYVSNRFASG